jgi:hypothetical protein
MRKLFLLAFALLLSPSLWATTYCVDQTLGSDAAAGTATGALCTGTVSAWKTLAKVNGFTFAAGDTILLKRGEVWREQLTNPSSGTSGNVITFGAYGSGAKPQINAAGIVNGAWTTNTAAYDFTFDADAGSPGNFTSKTDSGGFLTVVSNPANTGTSSYQLAPPSSANHYIEKTGLSYTSSLYSAFYVRFGSGFNWNEFQLFQARIAGDYFIDVDGNTNNGFPSLVFIHNKPANVNDLTNFPLTFNTWYLIEVTCTGIGTSSGVYTGYINGQKVFQTTGINWSAGYTITTERLGMVNQYGAATTGNLYLDNGWTHSSTTAGAPNTWKATLATQPKVVLFDGSHGVSRDTQGALVSTGDWTWAANTLYAYGTVAPSTSYSTIQGGVRDFAVLNDGKSWVTYDNLDLRNANQFALRVQNSAHVTLQNSLVTQSALGGTNVNNGGGQTASFLSYTGNEVSNNGGTGIEANCGACGAITVDQVSITNNYVHDNGWNPDNTTGYIWTTAGIKVFGTQTTHVSISNNLVTGQIYPYLYPSSAGDVISGSGIWLDTIGANAVAQYNVSHDNQGYGAVVEFTDVSPAPVLSYNVAYNNYGGIGSNRASHNVLIYNNSAFGNTFCGLCNEGVGAQTGQVGNQFKNNVSSGNLYNLVAQLGGDNAGGGSANVYDHNNFGLAATNFIQWGAGVFKSTYAALDTAYGSSTNSIQGNPLFASSSDLSLRAGSPAIDTGLNLGTTYQLGLDPRTTAPSFTTLNQNSFGAWDLGAFVALNIAPGGAATDIRYGSTLPPIAKVNSIFIINDGSGVIYTCAHAPTCTTASQWKTAVSGPPPVLSVSVTPDDLQFGTVQTGTSSQAQNVAISNTGTQPLTVGTPSVVFSGTGAAHFSSANTCAGELVDPGASCVELLQYNPVTAISDTATATIITNVPIDTQNPLIVALSGQGTTSTTFPLSINGSGTGGGTIVSNETPTPLINCFIDPPNPPSGRCSGNYASGATPTLTATPQLDSTFDSFSGGGCTISPCTVTVSASTTVTSAFTLIPQTNYSLSITGSGQGGGFVVSDRSAIGGLGILNCTITAGVVASRGNSGCSGLYPAGYVVTLTETPNASSTFSGWNGLCTGTATTCVITVDSNQTVAVSFAPTTAGVALVQSETDCSASGSTIACNWGTPQLVSDLIMCVGAWPDTSTTVSSITDTKGNTYTQFPTISPKLGTGITQVGYYAQNIVAATAGSNTTTMTLSSSAGAVSFSNLTTGSSVAATTSFATASVTPVANNIVLLTASARLGTGNGPLPISSITGDALTWTLYQGIDYGGGQGSAKVSRLEVWCGVGASPTTGAITINWPTSPSAVVWSVDQSAGAASTCAGAKGIVAANNADVTTASPLTVTMGTFGSASSATFGAGSVDGGSIAVGQGAGFTELGPNTLHAPSGETEYAAGNVSPVTMTYGSGPYKWGIIGIEIKRGSNRRDMRCAEYSGIKTSGSPIDQSIAAIGTGTAVTAGAITPTLNADLLTGFTASLGTVATADTGHGWTQRIKDTFGDDMEDQSNVAVAAYNFQPSLAASANWVAFNLAWFNSGGVVSTTLSLTITGQGNGSGTVSGNNGSPTIACTVQSGVTSGACSSIVSSGSSVTLTAQPSSGSSFVGWIGVTGCSSSPVCIVPNITSNQNITANFALAGGLTYWVATTGSNSNVCSSASPCATIAGVSVKLVNGSLAKGATGTTVRVRPGTYTADFQTYAQGTASAPITWISDTPLAAIIVGDWDFGNQPCSPQRACTGTLGGDYNVISGFTFTLPGGDISLSAGIQNYGGGGNFSKILNNYFHDVGTYGGPSPNPPCSHAAPLNLESHTHDVLVDGNRINRAGLFGGCPQSGSTSVSTSDHGIYVAGYHNTITNNLVSNVAGYGIVQYHNACENVVANNTVFHNFTGGIQVAAPADGISPCASLQDDYGSVTNNLVVRNGWGFATSAHGAFGIVYSTGVGAHNKAFNNLMAANIDSGGSNNTASNSIQVQSGNTIFPIRSNNISSTTTTGIFVNYLDDGSGDYRLATSSPAIDVGTSSTTACASSPGITPCVPVIDRLGVPRPNGPAYDIGAYEK